MCLERSSCGGRGGRESEREPAAEGDVNKGSEPSRREWTIFLARAVLSVEIFNCMHVLQLTSRFAAV